jgi:hypothetical protein
MTLSKDDVAASLAEAHFDLEPGMESIYRLVSTPENESSAAEPVKLLEVNRDAFSSAMRPVFFAERPADGVLYPIAIVEVTPIEFDQIRQEPSLLPNGWRIDHHYRRPVRAEVC